MDRAKWVPVAEVTRPHGLRGEVRVRLYNQGSEVLDAGVEIQLRSGDADGQPALIESVRGGGLGIKLAKLRGVDDPDQAARLRGAVMSVRRETFPALDGGEFYVCDIVGATVIGPDGELGTVEGIASYPGSDTLVVRRKGPPRDTVEVPLVDDFIETVDTEAGTVVAKEGILEFFR